MNLKHIEKLDKNESITLEHLYRYGPNARLRERAHMILLSNIHFEINLIAKITFHDRDTVTSYLNAWEENGLGALYDLPKTGRTRILTSEEETDIVKKVRDEPRQLNKTLSIIPELYKKTISKSTLKRILKRAGFGWKRARRVTHKKPDAEELAQCKERLKTLNDRETKGEIDLYYGDESGFTLSPYVPYAWQQQGERIEIPSTPSQRINVFGLLNKENDFHTFTTEGKIDSNFVIAVLDNFANKITKETWIVLDNASIHTSGKFIEKIEEWQALNLNIEHLSRYSPHLNLIERLWDRIKYWWLPFKAYISFENLKNELDDVLCKIGSEYRITFG